MIYVVVGIFCWLIWGGVVAGYYLVIKGVAKEILLVHGSFLEDTLTLLWYTILFSIIWPVLALVWEKRLSK